MTDTILLHNLWLSIPESAGGIRVYQPKISGFKKFLKKYRANKTSSINAVGRINLAMRVETYLDESAVCSWLEYFERVVYITLKCVLDGYADNGEGVTVRMDASAHGESSMMTVGNR